LKTKKIVTVCEGGAVRSVTLAFVLRYSYKVDAIPVSYRTSKKTLSMLFEWADKIIVVQEGMKDKIPVQFLEKVVVLEIGPDRWGRSLHPELMQLCIALVDFNKDTLKL